MFPIYLDYQATTPIDLRVLDSMREAYLAQYGNPSSPHHLHGKRAFEEIEYSRNQVANLISARDSEIIFTSGATEATNLIFFGLIPWLESSKRKHIITCVTEHKSVIEACGYLHNEGFEISFLPVRKDGTISLEVFRNLLRPETGLVSIMAANNEIGTLHPISLIGQICAATGALFHTDAAQAVGKIPLNFELSNVAFSSLSSHKVYGPSGIGAFYVSRFHFSKLSSVFAGGGQERGLRPGTLPTPLCVGFGKACAVANIEMEEEARRLNSLSNRLLNNLRGYLDEVFVNGSLENRLPGNLNLSFSSIDAEALLIKVREKLSFSSGSACSASSFEPSHVIKALNLGERRAESAVRLSIGRFTTIEDVDRSAEVLIKAVKEMRAIYTLSQ